MPVSGTDYMQTLGICTALIISEIDRDRAFVATDPMVHGIMSIVFGELSRYLIFASLIGSIATSYGSFMYNVRISTSSPTLLAAAGVLCYCIERAIDIYIRIFVHMYEDEIPGVQRVSIFLASSLPLYIFFVMCPIYSIILIQETEEKSMEYGERLSFMTPQRHRRR